MVAASFTAGIESMFIAIEPLARWVARSSAQAALVVALVMLLRRLAAPVLAARWRHALWGLVLLRLMLPVAPESRFSLLNITTLARSAWTALTNHHASNASPTSVAARPDPSGFIIHYGPLPTGAPAPQSNERAASDDLHIHPWLILAWLVGVVALLARLIASNITFWRRCARSRSSPSDELRRLLDDCGMQMGMSRARAPQLWITPAATAPAVAGLFRPRLLLPPAIASQLSSDQLRLVLLHELAHVKCRDIALEWLWTGVNVLHWFNPMLWLARPRRRADRGLARDAMVLAVTGAQHAQTYGQMILCMVQAAARQSARPQLAAGLVGMADARGDVRRRITMIARFDDVTGGRRLLSWAGIVLLAIAGCAALTDPRDANTSKTQAAAPTTQKSDTAAAREAEAREEAGDAAAAATSDRAHKSVADVKVQAALDRNMPEINFSAVPLSDVVDFLRDITNTNIFVNWKALEAAGIDRSTVVTARLRDVKFSKVLKMILGEVSAGGVKLGYEVDDGVITISTEEDLSKNVATRVYDIRDLIINVPDFNDAPPADFVGVFPVKSGAASQPATQPLSPRDEAVKRIVQLIQETIGPDSWKDKGGVSGSIRELAGQLIITQTPANQSEIERLLGQLRENRGLQVIVESRFLNVNPQELQGLSPKLRERLMAASGGAGAGDAPQQFLSNDDVQELLRAAQASRDASTLFAPRVTLFNGQRAYVMLASSLPYVASVSMIKGADGKVGYDPQVKQLQVGLLFDVQATLTADHRAAAVMLQPTISRLDRILSEPAPGTPADAQVFVQHPVLTIRQLHTTTTVPDGQTLLVGGFQDSTVGGDANEAPATQPVGERAVHELMNSAGGRRLFLLVKPTIVAPQEHEHAEPATKR